MTSRAHAKFDPAMMGVAIAVLRNPDSPVRQILQWPIFREVRTVDAESDGQEHTEDWLHLHEDDARAIYEALGEFFGHTGHDTRALRKDYDAERGRVDKLIGHLIGNR